MLRDEYCGRFGAAHLGQTVRACGWVAGVRDMGGVIFVDLADREGVLQVVLDASALPPAGFAAAERLKNQSVLQVCGLIRPRSEETRNPRIPTGEIELYAGSLVVLSAAKTLPFQLDGPPAGVPSPQAPREELRLKHRYLDLRRQGMQHNLRFRHRVQRAAQNYLDGQGFLAVETPLLTKSTPEGARDYIVPSRVHPGSFYALPQSPQIFKQLLMVGGVDRYYQIARCFRDEDLRADRQPEFTQVDLEMSFVEQEDVLQLVEGLLRHIWAAVMDAPLAAAPFPRLSWQQAMDSYGTDKPDLRFALPIVDLSGIMAKCGFGVFRRVVDGGGVVRAIRVPGGDALTRGDIDMLTEKAVGYGADGMAWISLRGDGSLNSILTKYFSGDDLQAIFAATGALPGDFVLFSAGPLATVRRVLGGLRGDVARLMGLIRPGQFAFAVVTDFPQFEYSAEERRFVAMHHPFTQPRPEDLDMLETDPAAVRALAYDFVLNGVELGSGSMRIHQSDVQARMFAALGFSQAEIRERFGFLVDAFGYGTPPHGGFAFGLDRLVMLLLQADSLREVIAFPKTREAACPLTGAPAPVEAGQLEDLDIALGQAAHTAGRQPRGAAAKEARVEVDMENVAQLARLWLSPEEKAAMAGDMARMVGFVDVLNELDTEGVPPATHAVALENVLRQDVPAPCLPRESLLAAACGLGTRAAPAAADGFILVPKVVQDGE